MPQPDPYDDYDYISELLVSGTEDQWRELELLVDGFPRGVDGFIGRHWITNAVDCGSVASVRWMLACGVNLRFRDDEGYTVVHSALERSAPDRYALLELLLGAGADVDAKGSNDWTPAHHAAASEDITALSILVAHGADLSIRTGIDDYATPLEEARSLKKWKSVAFLESLARRQ